MKKLTLILSALLLSACGQIDLDMTQVDTKKVECYATSSKWAISYDLNLTNNELASVRATITDGVKTYSQDVLLSPYSAAWSEKAVYVNLPDKTQYKMYYIKETRSLYVSENNVYLNLTSNVCK